MHIVYNGISLDVIHLDHLFYDVVTDDSQTDYVCTKVEILCSAMVNGQAEVRDVAGPPISYVPTGGESFRQTQAIAARPAGVPAPPVLDSFPPDTHANPLRNTGVAIDFASEAAAGPYLRTTSPPAFAREARRVEVVAPGPGSPILTTQLVQKRLTDLRGKLFVFSGTGSGVGQLLLQSPDWDRHCDVKNGPKPTHFGITQSFNDATMLVQFGIETYIHHQKRTDYNDPLLSNRFSMRHSLDDHSWLRIETLGTAVFDVGLLHDLGFNPDALRPRLLLPVPFGFVRSGIEVTGLPDMSGVEYAFVDTQQKVHFPAGPFVQAQSIEAVHRQAVLCDTDVLAGALQSYEGVINRQWIRDARQEIVEARAKKKKAEEAREARAAKRR